MSRAYEIRTRQALDELVRVVSQKTPDAAVLREKVDNAKKVLNAKFDKDRQRQAQALLEEDKFFGDVEGILNQAECLIGKMRVDGVEDEELLHNALEALCDRITIQVPANAMKPAGVE